MSNCRSGCPTQNHRSWGECARAARLMVGWAQSAKGLDRTADKKNQAELDLYKSARDAGIQPDGTYTNKIRFAMEQSEKVGARYGEEFNVVPRGDGKGYDPVFKKDVDKVMSECVPSDLKAIYDTAKKIPGSGVM